MNLVTLFIFILSLFQASDGAVTKNRIIDMAGQPKWNMMIANLSADAGKDFPFSEYVSQMFPSKQNPPHREVTMIPAHATCQASTCSSVPKTPPLPPGSVASNHSQLTTIFNQQLQIHPPSWKVHTTGNLLRPPPQPDQDQAQQQNPPSARHSLDPLPRTFNRHRWPEQYLGCEQRRRLSSPATGKRIFQVDSAG